MTPPLTRLLATMLVTVVVCPSLGVAQGEPSIRLDLKPRVCTMTATDDACETTVRAQWQATRDESLCLVIVGRPEVKRCWENFSEGRYSIELSFAEDLIVQLRDPALENILAS